MDKEDTTIVSIIVPVYNAEKYLARCLDSILSQTLTSIEVICINDGSTDRSLEILTCYAEQDPRVKVLTQMNQGAAKSRLSGINIAEGRYIGFVDSDDWIEQNMYEKLVLEAEKHSCDLVLCDFYRSGITGLQWSKSFTGHKLTVQEFMDISAPPFLCMKLFRSTLKTYMLQAVGNNQAEDVGLLYPVLPHVTKIGYVPEPLYYYFQRTDSSSHSDSFIANYCIDEYLDTVRQLLAKDYGRYTPNAKRHFVQMIYYGLKSPARICFRADYIEFLQEISPHLIGCPTLRKFEDLSQYLCCETIPATLVCSSSDNPKPNNTVCMDSWSNYARHCTIRKIELKSLENVPDVVKDAEKLGEVKFVEDYAKARYIYEHGGIAVGSRVKLNRPIGELRSYAAFWGYAEGNKINSEFWGAVKFHPLIKRILDSYEEESILNKIDVDLGMRAYFALCKEYNLPQGDTNEHQLGDGIRVFRCDKLTYKVNANNVAQLYDEAIDYIESYGLVAAPQGIIEMLILEARKSEARKKLPARNENVTYYKNELTRIKNSRSWKITRPLRRLFNLFRRVKYSEREIE